MRFLRLHPDKAYRGSMLWVPKQLVPLDALETSLTYWFTEPTPSGEHVAKAVHVWEEEVHHYALPREFPREQVPCEVIDLAPPTELVTYHSTIRPRDESQAAAMDAMRSSRSGILNLGCVAEGTELRLNRGGKGFRMNIETAYERFNGLSTRYTWDPNIPTYTRAKKGDVIGLTEVAAIIYKGMRPTVKVTLEDGTTLIVTEDHELLSSSGFLAASSFLLRDAVVDTQERIGRKPKPRYKRLSWPPSHPYAKYVRKKGRKDGYLLEEHRAVAEATLNNMTLLTFRVHCQRGDVGGLVFLDPQEYVVHHEDENTENNHPDNLTIMRVAAHRQHHHLGYRAFGKPGVRKVSSVEPAGVRHVYDAVCVGPHRNFVANGVVVHNCGRGKTVVGLDRIAFGRGPGLVIVNDKGLLAQWHKEVFDKLQLSNSEIGHVIGPKNERDRPIVLATVQTLWRRIKEGLVPEWVRRRFATVLYDEAHHMAAMEFNRVASFFTGDRFGLTATRTRLDGNERFFEIHLGRVLYSDLSVDVPPVVYLAHTGLKPTSAERDGFYVGDNIHIGKVRQWQAKHPQRNPMIAGLAQNAQGVGHKVLVLSHLRDDHIPRLQKVLPGCGVVTGKVRGEKRLSNLSGHDVIVGTMGAAREGLDRPDLNVVIFVTTFANENDFQQATGRVARACDGKVASEAIFLVDDVPKCLDHAKHIERFAKKRGYQVEHFRLEEP